MEEEFKYQEITFLDNNPELPKKVGKQIFNNCWTHFFNIKDILFAAQLTADAYVAGFERGVESL